ncbi:MAG: TetR/AcrR family transcriptional regulator [Mycolicibacterium hassiacum]
MSASPLLVPPTSRDLKDARGVSAADDRPSSPDRAHPLDLVKHLDTPDSGSANCPGRMSAAAKRRKVTDLETERRLLLEAAMQVLERTGWWGFKVDSVLRQANLSTRSFYRHFQTKTDLLLAVLEDEMSRVTRHLVRLTSAAATPYDKVQAYLAAIIDMAYRPQLTKRATLFSSQWRDLQQHYPETLRRCRQHLIAPLEQAIRDGQQAGIFRVEDPAAAATVVFYLAAGMTADEVTLGCAMPRAEFEAIILPFVDRALGIG